MNYFKVTSNTNCQHWEEILANYFFILEKAGIHSNGTDSPYIHCELGNKHALAVAINNSFFSTICEYLGQTYTGSKRELDICFFNSEMIEEVECKWLEYNGSGEARTTLISNKLREAKSQLDNFSNKSQLYKKYEEVNKTSVLFITPNFVEQPTEQTLKKCSESVADKFELDAFGYCYPEKNRSTKYYNDIFYPGVIVAIQRHTVRS